jgi:hypothetical protein
MTENSTSDVGQAAIDNYLDAVEQALIAAHAPRSDRVQVLHDLEAQIADMLAREPQPITQEIVQAMIAKLEPTGHFAATYGNGKQPPIAPSGSRRAFSKMRWSHASAACFGVFVLGCLLLLGLEQRIPIILSLFRHNLEVVQLLILFGFLATPCALAMAYRQLHAQPDRCSDRDFVLNLASGYVILASTFLILLSSEWTHGFVLISLGVAALIFLQYTLVRHLRRLLRSALPPESPSASSQEPRASETGLSVGVAMSMPAM